MSDDASGSPLTRRPVLKLLTGGAVAMAGIGVGVGQLSGSSDGSRHLPGMVLSSHPEYGVDSLDVPLGSQRLASVGHDRWQTTRLPTSTHSMVAVTWDRSAAEPSIRIRSRIGGSWEPWRALRPQRDVPDVDSTEHGAVAGTDLLWVGAADGVQVEVNGHRPDNLTLVLLHPGRLAGRTLGARQLGTRRKMRERRRARAPMPALLRRRDWGADKDWRPDPPYPYYNDTIEQVHVHHTVNSNTYAEDDVPGLIRGMYRYHTYNLGWSDIGYNFLVDRFGRTWVGRAGGARRPVRGAHTLGFNATSCGVSVIGNFETAKPTDEVLGAIASLAAWKLDKYDGIPDSQVTVTSEGSDKYAPGRSVQLPVIDGHRDTNDTACPGRYLYESLPDIRARARAIVDAYPQA